MDRCIPERAQISSIPAQIGFTGYGRLVELRESGSQRKLVLKVSLEPYTYRRSDSSFNRLVCCTASILDTTSIEYYEDVAFAIGYVIAGITFYATFL